MGQHLPLSQINIPVFAGESLSTTIKILNQLDLFENDGIVAAIPFGKILTSTWKLAREIKDPSKAIRYSVGKAVGICFSAGLKVNGIDELELSEGDAKIMKEALKLKYNEFELNPNQFDSGQVWNNEITQEFLGIYDSYFHRSELSKEKKEKLGPRVKDFVQVWLDIYWWRIIERQRDRFKSLDEHLSSKSRQLEIEAINLEAYYAGLASLYLENTHAQIPLNKLYVSPYGSVLKAICRKENEDGDDNTKYRKNEKVGLPKDLHDFTLKWIKDELQFDELYDNEFRLLLLFGQPGQGKTSFCKRLLFDLIQERYWIQKPIYFVRLRRVENPGKLKSSPLGVIAETINSTYSLSIGTKELQQSILILDGMDELSMTSNLSMREADEVVQEIINSIRHYPECKIILTSRHGYLLTEKQLPFTLVQQIREMDLDQQKKWVNQYIQYSPKSILNIDNLIGIDPNSPLGELIKQPILLQMIAELDELPESTASRAAVYNALFDHVIDTPWKKGQIDALQGLNRIKAKRLFRKSLQEIAFSMYQNEYEFLPGEKIEKLTSVKKLINELRDVASYRDTLKTMFISFYFQEVQSQKGKPHGSNEDQFALEFMHKSFSEYLVAEYIHDRVYRAFLSRDSEDDYVIFENQTALEWWNKNISQRPLSSEIVDYLIGLILEDKDDNQRQELKERLLSFGNFFIENGFINDLDPKKYPFSAIDRGIESFYVWFSFVSFLDSNPLLLKNKPYKDKFFKFFKLLVSNGINLRRISLSKEVFEDEVNLSGTVLVGANFEDTEIPYGLFAGVLYPMYFYFLNMLIKKKRHLWKKQSNF